MFRHVAAGVGLLLLVAAVYPAEPPVTTPLPTVLPIRKGPRPQGELPKVTQLPTFAQHPEPPPAPAAAPPAVAPWPVSGPELPPLPEPAQVAPAPPPSVPPAPSPVPALTVPPAPICLDGCAEAKPPEEPLTLESLAKKVEALTGKITIGTADGSWKIGVFGWLQGTLIYSSARPVVPGAPFFLAPDSPFGFNDQTIDVHARASAIGAILQGPEVCGWETGGVFLAFFYNDNILEDRYGVLPFLMYGQIKNENWRFAAGLQRDIFNPVDPTMLDFAVLFASGNTGNYRGQLRVERFLNLGDDAQVTLTGGLSDPITTIISRDLDLSEDNGWPNCEGRVSLGLGPLAGAGLTAGRPFEVGLSGVVGQVRTTVLDPARRVVADVRGLGVDARWRVTKRFGFQGEAYTGQALGTYNGGILQNVNRRTFEPIRSTGAWAEAYYYLVPDKLHVHGGYGVDDPLDRDVGNGILRNRTYFGNVIWDVSKALRLGLEMTWRKTAYRGQLNNEGVTFQSVAQWNF